MLWAHRGRHQTGRVREVGPPLATDVVVASAVSSHVGSLAGLVGRALPLPWVLATDVVVASPGCCWHVGSPAACGARRPRSPLAGSRVPSVRALSGSLPQHSGLVCGRRSPPPVRLCRQQSCRLCRQQSWRLRSVPRGVPVPSVWPTRSRLGPGRVRVSEWGLAHRVVFASAVSWPPPVFFLVWLERSS